MQNPQIYFILGLCITRCVAEVAMVTNHEDMMETCMHSSDPFLDHLQCRWDLKFKNESSIDSWLAARVWPIYFVLSLLVTLELLLSSYVNDILYGDLENYLYTEDEGEGE